jgi:hypothetical protein
MLKIHLTAVPLQIKISCAAKWDGAPGCCDALCIAPQDQAPQLCTEQEARAQHPPLIEIAVTKIKIAHALNNIEEVF